MRTFAFAVLFAAGLCGAWAQIVNPPQGGGAWPVWAATNAAETRTNLGLGAGWLTNTNTPLFTQGSNPATVLSPWIVIGTNVGALQIASNAISGPGSGMNFAVNEIWGSWGFYNEIRFIGTNATTAAAITRTNLGLGASWLTNSNVPVPYSGAAPVGALLQADGAGGSAFVPATRQVIRLTNDISTTNYSASWVATGSFEPVENMRINLDANSAYRVFYSLRGYADGCGIYFAYWNSLGTNSIYAMPYQPTFVGYGSVFATNSNPRNLYFENFAGGQFCLKLCPVGATYEFSTANQGGGNTPWMIITGEFSFVTGESNSVLVPRFALGGTNTTNAAWLYSGSIIIIDKISE